MDKQFEKLLLIKILLILIIYFIFYYIYLNIVFILALKFDNQTIINIKKKFFFLIYFVLQQRECLY